MSCRWQQTGKTTEKLASLGIQGVQSKSPLKPLDTIARGCSIRQAMIPREASFWDSSRV